MNQDRELRMIISGVTAQKKKKKKSPAEIIQTNNRKSWILSQISNNNLKMR